MSVHLQNWEDNSSRRDLRGLEAVKCWHVLGTHEAVALDLTGASSPGNGGRMLLAGQLLMTVRVSLTTGPYSQHTLTPPGQ